MTTHSSQALIEACHWIGRQGWCPATGGNFSARIDEDRVQVTASGCHKAYLTASDLLIVDLDGQPFDRERKPSAETLLHTRLYRLDRRIGAVLHTHSVAATVVSQVTEGYWLSIADYEMQKALAGNVDHGSRINIAIFDNDQDMVRLAGALASRWDKQPLHWGFLVRGHGLYAWGDDIDQARRHLEGLEFLLACQLEMRRLGAQGTVA